MVLSQTPMLGGMGLKRVVAIPGDTIAGDPQSVRLNGKLLEEPYIRTASDEGSPPGPHESFGPVTIPQNQYFVMGDNRHHSLDSRFPGFGLVPRDHILGTPLFVYYSAEHWRIGRTIR